MREVCPTKLSFTQLYESVDALAKQESLPLSFTELAKQSGVFSVVARKLISGLASIFIIRLLKIEGGRKGWILYFEDQAESLHMSSQKLDPNVYYSGLLYRNLRAEFFYSPEKAAQSFLKNYTNAKVLMVHPHARLEARSARIALLPDWLLL